MNDNPIIFDAADATWPAADLSDPILMSFDTGDAYSFDDGKWSTVGPGEELRITLNPDNDENFGVIEIVPVDEGDDSPTP